MNVSGNLKKIRLLKGINQSFMASQLGISIKAYSKIENNQIKLTVERLFQLAETLKVEPSAFFESNLKTQAPPAQNPQIENYQMFANKLVETLERLIIEKDKHIAELHQKNAEMEL